jgi:4-hydroxy-tetrahydrodipicolinate synthase
LDSDNNLHLLTQLKMQARADFCLLTENDVEAIGFLLNGGNGCVSVLANIFPALCSEFYNTCREGRLKSARAIAGELTSLAIRFSGVGASAGLKYTLSMLGFMKPKVRLPLIELDPMEKVQIAQILKEICECDEAELTAAH